jgi:hypothetical protein
MKVVFLVPRRKDDGPRDRIWAYCRARWERCSRTSRWSRAITTTGAFNRSAAINRAAELADEGGPWDIGIVIDADVVLSESQVRAAIETAADTGRVTWAHRRWRGVREDATRRILDDRRDLGAELDRDELDLIVERTNPLSWSCCIAMPRAVFDDLGGFDERFEGWGFEDMAFQSVICGLYGYERIPGDVVHLYHPRSEERITPGETRLTATREYVTNARLGRRYMVALRRDYALHDRGDQPASEAERLRDIENLRRDDEKYSPVVARLKLPDWSTWWPTLEELRDGAKAYREGRGQIAGVTVVVRTGGAPETWEARSEYLRRSLASLDEHVKGPIVQRVIYSDWGATTRTSSRRSARRTASTSSAAATTATPAPSRACGATSRTARWATTCSSPRTTSCTCATSTSCRWPRPSGTIPRSARSRSCASPATRASSRGTASSAGRRSRSRRRTRATATAASSTATSGR